jgi:hypothetical protein
VSVEGKAAQADEPFGFKFVNMGCGCRIEAGENWTEADAAAAVAAFVHPHPGWEPPPYDEMVEIWEQQTGQKFIPMGVEYDADSEAASLRVQVETLQAELAESRADYKKLWDMTIGAPISPDDDGRLEPTDDLTEYILGKSERGRGYLNAAAALAEIRRLHQPTPKLSAEREAERRLRGWKEDAPQYCTGCGSNNFEAALGEWPCATELAIRAALPEEQG